MRRADILRALFNKCKTNDDIYMLDVDSLLKPGYEEVAAIPYTMYNGLSVDHQEPVGGGVTLVHSRVYGDCDETLSEYIRLW